MVRVTHRPRFPLLKKRFDPWFESSIFPFSRTTHPWFRADPWEELELTWGDYLDYMERFQEEFPSMKKFTRDITCDLADKGDRFVLTADIPGMEKEEVNVNVVDNEIEISAEHKESKDESKKGYVRKERSEVRYYRSLSLPEEIVSSKVTAKMNNGILTVELPKKIPTKIEEPVTVKVQ
jgi:HSP20 family protein